MARNHDMSDGRTVGSLGDHSLEISSDLMQHPRQGCVALAMSPGNLGMSHCVG